MYILVNSFRYMGSTPLYLVFKRYIYTSKCDYEHSFIPHVFVAHILYARQSAKW